MHVENLRRIYVENEVVRAICDHMANRLRNQTETKLERMISNLEGEGFDFKKSEVISSFRLLEEAGCGKYVEGRHGWRSRFVWSVKTRMVARVAQGTDTGELLETEDEEDESQLTDELIEHSFVLRPDVIATIELPADLTQSEAQRLSHFMAALSFEE